MSDEGNPWPGFVDALSTTLLVFVFLVVVLVLVVTALALQVGKQLEEAQATSDTAAVAAGKADLDLVTGEKLYTESGEYELKTENMIEKKTAATINIAFKDLSTVLDKNTQTELDNWINENKEKVLSAKKIYVLGLLSAPNVPTGTSYYVSYSRTMRIRHTLLQAGVGSERIITRVNKSTEKEENKVILKIE